MLLVLCKPPPHVDEGDPIFDHGDQLTPLPRAASEELMLSVSRSYWMS